MLEATPQLMAQLMYGSGVRLMELLRLRIKDVDLERRQLFVRAGKGGKDRVTVLPKVLLEPLKLGRTVRWISFEFGSVIPGQCRFSLLTQTQTIALYLLII